ncbi:MAG: hypothetical protein JWO50_300 [Candidatus Kaiserbacteria bacterium]|nr:hypothetical protein [Candidatus Kaiserbacteria bacterium]
MNPFEKPPGQPSRTPEDSQREQREVAARLDLPPRYDVGREDMVSLLHKNDAVKIIESTTQIPIEQEHDYSQLEDLGDERSEKTIKRIIDGLVQSAVKYLNGVYIEDSFGSDKEARDAWEQQKRREFGTTFENFSSESKYRLNVITNVKSYVESFVMAAQELNIHGPAVDEVMSLDKSLLIPDGDTWAHFSYEEKRVVTDKIDVVCKKILELFTKQSE